MIVAALPTRHWRVMLTPPGFALSCGRPPTHLGRPTIHHVIFNNALIPPRPFSSPLFFLNDFLLGQPVSVTSYLNFPSRHVLTFSQPRIIILVSGRRPTPLVPPFRANGIVIQFNQAVSNRVPFLKLVLRFAVRERRNLLAGMDSFRDGLIVSTTTGWSLGTPVLRRVICRMEGSDTMEWALRPYLRTRNRGRIKCGVGTLKGSNWGMLTSILWRTSGWITNFLHGSLERIQWNRKYWRKRCTYLRSQQ
jgi:hypothetical protein